MHNKSLLSEGPTLIQSGAPAAPQRKDLDPRSTKTTDAQANNMEQPSDTEAQPTTKKTKKRKREEKLHILHQCTLRKQRWSYLNLELITPSTAAPSNAASTASGYLSPTSTPATPSIDAVTATTLLFPAIRSYLGLHGAAIPIDILKTLGRQVWLRVPREDGKAVQAALSSWTGVADAGSIPGAEMQGGGKVRVGWRVRGVGESSGVLAGDGYELFDS